MIAHAGNVPLLMRNRFMLRLSLILLCVGGCASAATLDPLLTSWLAAQTNIQSWSADFVQTRTFKTLTQPLTGSGHVWFAAPNRFRWELGHPTQTIAVREPQELRVIYPRLKRAERYPLNGNETGPWHEALGLLQAGFPRSQAELESQYNVLSEITKGEVCQVALQPKSTAARRMMSQIEIDFDVKDFLPRGTELKFADGSTLRNDFSDAVLNPKLDEQLFSPQIPSDYKITEPLHK
jgi:outer membrane lipoprotein-sorting protein